MYDDILRSMYVHFAYSFVCGLRTPSRRHRFPISRGATFEFHVQQYPITADRAAERRCRYGKGDVGTVSSRAFLKREHRLVMELCLLRSWKYSSFQPYSKWSDRECGVSCDLRPTACMIPGIFRVGDSPLPYCRERIMHFPLRPVQ